MPGKVVRRIVIAHIWKVVFADIIPYLFFCPKYEWKNMTGTFHAFSDITLFRLVGCPVVRFIPAHSFQISFPDAVVFFQQFTAPSALPGWESLFCHKLQERFFRIYNFYLRVILPDKRYSSGRIYCCVGIDGFKFNPGLFGYIKENNTILTPRESEIINLICFQFAN